MTPMSIQFLFIFFTARFRFSPVLTLSRQTAYNKAKLGFCHRVSLACLADFRACARFSIHFIKEAYSFMRRIGVLTSGGDSERLASEFFAIAISRWRKSLIAPSAFP